MRYDPRDRLRRPFPGERFLREDPSITAVFERAEEKEVRDLIPRRDLKTGREQTKTRSTRKLATAGPNAPSLIRLVRYPFRLQTVRGSKKRYYQRPEAVEKVDWRAEVEASKVERERKASVSPAGQRPRAFAVQPSRWKILKTLGEKE